MPDRQVGDTFRVGTQEWRVYKIEDDGTICSRIAGLDTTPPVVQSRHCSYRGGLHRTIPCRNLATTGQYCDHHQYANRTAP